MTFLVKLVKTAKCHQNMSKRPVLVPIFQNGSRKSPLKILRFPFSVAFSPKELMGHSDASVDFIVKTTKCRPVAHPVMSREVGAQIPPQSPQQAASGDCSSSELSAVFSTVLVLAVLLLIMTETVFWGRVVTEACGRSILGQF